MPDLRLESPDTSETDHLALTGTAGPDTFTIDGALLTANDSSNANDSLAVIVDGLEALSAFGGDDADTYFCQNNLVPAVLDGEGGGDTYSVTFGGSFTGPITIGDTGTEVRPGADGVLCVDWLNGCRTPLMDGSLTGMFTGLTLSHTPAHLYRALLEASALGLRWIVDLLREHGVPVERFVATGGLPHQNPLLVQIYADVLGGQIDIHPSRQGPALGAAILGALAAGSFATPTAAIESMAVRKATRVQPSRTAARQYDPIYARYRAAAHWHSANS